MNFVSVSAELVPTWLRGAGSKKLPQTGDFATPVISAMLLSVTSVFPRLTIGVMMSQVPGKDIERFI